VQTDSAGDFRLSGIEPGEHTLHAFASGHGRAQHRIEVAAGDRVEDIRLTLNASGVGTDIDPSSAGVAVTLGERDGNNGTHVVLVHVSEGSEAERAGLRRGDVLQELDGIAPTDMRDARARLNGAPGADLVIMVRRKGRALSFRVRREQLSR
jgi:S1-C subfamily serine protease